MEATNLSCVASVIDFDSLKVLVRPFRQHEYLSLCMLHMQR